jgi:D-serine dehydratase
MNQGLDEKRQKLIKDLKQQLEKPYVQPIKSKRMSKSDRQDPIRKILQTNDKINQMSV